MERRKLLFGGAGLAAISQARGAEAPARPSSGAASSGESVRAADYGLSPAASAAANAAAIQKAYDALGGTYGGEILLPRGQFRVAADVIKPVTRNVRIRGMGPGMSYDGASRAGTSLIFSGGAVAIDFSTWSGGSSGGFYELMDINIDGSKTTEHGVLANGQVLIDNVTVNNFKAACIILNDRINTARLQNFSCGGSPGVGLLIGGPRSGSNTTVSCENFTLRQNGTGLRIVNARGFAFRNGVIEANSGAGLEIHQPAGGQVNNGHFEDVWFEENRHSGKPGHQVVIGSQTAGDRPTSIRFVNCALEATRPTDAVNITNGEYIVFEDCDYTSGASITFGADTYRCANINHDGPAHVNGVVRDSGRQNYVGLIDASGPQVKTTTVPSFTATLTGCTSSPTYAVRYVKNGNTVTLEIPDLAGTSNATTKTLTGLPPELQPASRKQALLASVQDNGGALTPALVRIQGGSIIYFANAGGAAFTAKGAFSAHPVLVTYTLA